MGIYPADCKSCGVSFQWFSGNIDQLCFACWTQDSVEVSKNIKESNNMTNDQKLIAALEMTIKIQGELIEFLKSELVSIKNPTNTAAPHMALQPPFGTNGDSIPANTDTLKGHMAQISVNGQNITSPGLYTSYINWTEVCPSLSGGSGFKQTETLDDIHTAVKRNK